MLGFLAPFWLAALASLAVPLALHLWSRRTGRAVRVGSIRLLSGSPPPMVRRPHLYDPWLLALRCALLAALVLALARPYWAPHGQTAPPPWALVATDVVDRAGLVDSLDRAGRTVRPLDPRDLWLSLAIADQAAPPGTQFEVFAAPLLSGTRGTRPQLRSPVVWHPRAAAQEPASPAAPRSRGRIVVVFADADRSDDARYVAAAVQAAGMVSGIPAIVTIRAAAASVAVVGSTDWIVWLSEQPLPEVVERRLQAGATVITDLGRAQRPLTRAAFGPDHAPVWTDATGEPLLTVTREGSGLRYRFHRRFAPSSSSLVLDPRFPEAMARLWIGSDSTRIQRDDRPIALSQVAPAYDPRVGSGGAATGARSLFLPLWLIAVALFLVERRIAMGSAVR